MTAEGPLGFPRPLGLGPFTTGTQNRIQKMQTRVPPSDVSKGRRVKLVWTGEKDGGSCTGRVSTVNRNRAGALESFRVRVTRSQYTYLVRMGKQRSPKVYRDDDLAVEYVGKLEAVYLV